MNNAKRVLVVDDDNSIREFVELVLADEGYEVATAEHGARALKLLEHWQPDLILLDLRTPIMDGWEFAQAYHAMAGPHAPIVVMAAVNDTKEVLRRIQAENMLPKPFELGDLLEMVSEHVYGRPAP